MSFNNLKLHKKQWKTFAYKKNNTLASFWTIQRITLNFTANILEKNIKAKHAQVKQAWKYCSQ